jgi:hypothetical protein
MMLPHTDARLCCSFGCAWGWTCVGFHLCFVLLLLLPLLWLLPHLSLDVLCAPTTDFVVVVDVARDSVVLGVLELLSVP